MQLDDIELQIHPLAMNKIRARLRQNPMEPFVLITGLKTLARILESSTIELETVKAHSKELKPGMWHFNVAKAYSTSGKPILNNLVAIGNKIGEFK